MILFDSGHLLLLFDLGLKVCLRLQAKFFVVKITLTADWKLNIAVGVKRLFVNIREPDLKGGNDDILYMVSQPPIVQRVDDLYLKSVESVVYGDVIFLLEVQMLIEDPSCLKDPRVAA